MDNQTQTGTVSAMHDMPDALSPFSSWQRQRGFSAATIKRRRVSISAFGRWMHPATLAQATTMDVEEWLATFRHPGTRHAYRSDLATFYRWANRRNVLSNNPMIDTDPIKVPRSLPRPVSPEAVRSLIDAAPEQWVGTAIALAAYAGLRRAEVAALDWEDVNLHGSPPLLMVRCGKGSKDRIVPIHPELGRRLGAPRRGSVVGHSVEVIGARVAQHLRACGVDATMHQLRHTFGTELCRVSGGNLILTGSLMGHESPDTTKGYVGWAGGDAAAAVVQMFGRSELKAS